MHLKCHHCGASHLDDTETFFKDHRRHRCNVCAKLWTEPQPSVGNPLAVLRPKLHGGVLQLEKSSGNASSMLALEPSFLAAVHQG